MIFFSIHRPTDACRALRVGRQAGVVAGCHEIGSDLLAVSPELAEFEPDIAENARIRRPTGDVFVGEFVHDSAEFAFEIEDVERNVETVGNATGVQRVGDAATCLGATFFLHAVRRPCA